MAESQATDRIFQDVAASCALKVGGKENLNIGERESVCVCVRVRERTRVGERVCVCERVRERESGREWERKRERERFRVKIFKKKMSKVFTSASTIRIYA